MAKQYCDMLTHSIKQWCYDVRQNPLLLAWNVSAILSVFVPLVVYWIQDANEQASGDADENNNNGWSWWWNNNNNDDDNNNNNNNDEEEEQGGWWFQFWSGGENDRREEEGGTGGFVFVYLWTLVMFVVLVYHGHGHISSRSSSNSSFLLALFMFANLSFVACLLTGISIRNMDERAMEEQGFFGMFAGCMVITYALWTFLCSVFCGILYKPNDKDNDTSTDYQRHSDDANNSNNNRWWGGGSKEKKKEKSQEESNSGWMSGWNISEKEETTGTGIVVKTQGEDEDAGSMAPFECFGSDKKADGKEGTMA